MRQLANTTNKNGIELAGSGAISGGGSSITIDERPIENSNNPVRGGFLYSMIQSYNEQFEEITDAINDINTYSTTEKIIGTWIDDSPIYQRIISGVISYDSGNTFLYDFPSNIDITAVISLTGYVYNDSDSSYVMLPYGAGRGDSTSAIRALCMKRTTTNAYAVGLVNTWSAMYGKNVTLIIQYARRESEE